MCDCASVKQSKEFPKFRNVFELFYRNLDSNFEARFRLILTRFRNFDPFLGLFDPSRGFSGLIKGF